MTKRIILVSLCFAMALTVIILFLFFLNAKNAAIKTVEEYLDLESQMKLPAEYCLENENLTISAKELEKIKSEFSEQAKCIMTDEYSLLFCEYANCVFDAQAQKKYTVSEMTREFIKTDKLRFVDFNSVIIDITAAYSSVEYDIKDGILNRYDICNDKGMKYEICLKKENGKWLINDMTKNIPE